MVFLKNLKVPLQSKVVFQRVVPNYMLAEKLKNLDLVYRPDSEFLSRFEMNAKSENPSGFEMPFGPKQNLPFFIQRTETGSLPVYIDYKNGRTRTMTIVRKVQGNIVELQKELMKLTQQQVMERVGRLETKGNHVRLILLYLRSLGF